MEVIKIKSEYIRLCDAMKLANTVESGGMAKILIVNGEVTVNGETCLMKGKKLYPGDHFTVSGEGEFEIQ